jgi:hypothetical protein
MNANRVDRRANIGIAGLSLAIVALVAGVSAFRPEPPSQVMDPPLEQLGSVTTSMSPDDTVARSLLASEQPQ